MAHCILTVCDEIMSTFHIAPLESCAYHSVGVSGSVERVSDLTLTSDPSCSHTNNNNSQITSTTVFTFISASGSISNTVFSSVISALSIVSKSHT